LADLPGVEIEDSLATAYAPFRFLAAGAGLIAALTLLLASVGLYGVVSLMVNGRTRCTGDLGARPSRRSRGPDRYAETRMNANAPLSGTHRP
jgi:hypothetical protein